MRNRHFKRWFGLGMFRYNQSTSVNENLKGTM